MGAALRRARGGGGQLRSFKPRPAMPAGTTYDHAAMMRDGSTRPHPPSHGPSRILAEKRGRCQWELHVTQDRDPAPLTDWDRPTGMAFRSSAYQMQGHLGCLARLNQRDVDDELRHENRSSACTT